MKKDLLSANPYIPVEHGASVSFRMFIDFIAQRSEMEQGNRKYFYKYILEKFQHYPELYGDISIDKIGDYEEILQLIAYCVMPVLEDENEMLWALGKTFSPHFFYGSDAFYKLLNKINSNGTEETLADKEEAMRIHKELQYSFILEKLYGIKTFSTKEWIHRVIDAGTGLYQYYRLSIDRRFSWLEAKNDLPEFDSCSIENCSNNDEAMKMLQEQLPVHLFEGKGFTIMSLTDVTAQHAIDQMSRLSVNDNESKSAAALQHINRLLQTIVGSNAYQFGIMPFLTINQRAAVLYEKYPFSIIADACWKSGVSTHSFTTFIKGLEQSPGVRTYKEGVDLFPEEITHALQLAGIKFYILFPAYYNNQLVGVLEVSSIDATIQLNEHQLTALQPAMHSVGRLLQQIINKFTLRIENIVKDKFTNIQPSVQWKFNEVAWHYLRSNFLNNKDETIENITFTGVQPLYGAVDIRNSTIERNAALRDDTKTQLYLLMEVFDSIHAPAYESLVAGIRHTANEWLQKSSGFFNVTDEIEFDDFLTTAVYPFLETLRHTPGETAEKIQLYYAAIDERTGIAFENRRQLETSMQLINNAISYFYDDAKEKLQNIYPSYFDKFRTDGVEYDIYVGQSIAPKIPFEKQHLQQYRFWQLQSMANIARLTHSLLAEMPRYLQTTQLLFVHSEAIDISFRNDERRFDVEGAYNIRYQVIKKRIDKVHIHGTTERLTQPGKIAIVYFHRHDVENYIEYIRQLQQQNVLIDDLEFLELEELQGVSGLQALRVSVQY